MFNLMRQWLYLRTIGQGSNPGSSSNMSLVRPTITKMADKMAAAAYQFGASTVVVTLGHFYSDFFQFSYMDCFHLTLVQV